MSSRREFLKDAAIIGGGAVALGVLANREREEDKRAKKTKKELDKLKKKK